MRYGETKSEVAFPPDCRDKADTFAGLERRTTPGEKKYAFLVEEIPRKSIPVVRFFGEQQWHQQTNDTTGPNP